MTAVRTFKLEFDMPAFGRMSSKPAPNLRKIPWSALRRKVQCQHCQHKRISAL